MGPAGRKRTGLLVTVAVYGVLVVLGAVEGLIGSFQYGNMAGSVPVAAIAADAVILVTCLLAGWAVRSVSGALAPAAGWILASFVLSMPVSNGSVIITDTTAGKWYLYGGTLSTVIGVALSFGLLARARPR
ncbi:MAG TPA: DUF6113 family protein [Streptosporangiaceae bacterium]|nr:DUF6113 family protein [Streptosporangiaceae bacterium]